MTSIANYLKTKSFINFIVTNYIQLTCKIWNLYHFWFGS